MNRKPHRRMSGVRIRVSELADTSFWLVLVLQLAILAFAFMQSAIPVEHLLRDGGAISDFGVLLWAATAGVCALAALFLFCTTSSSRNSVTFVAAAAFSGILALDDLFMLHDNILPNMGIPEMWVFAAYVLFTFAYVGLSWRNVFVAAPWFLVFTGAVFAAGLAIDIAKDVSSGSLLGWLTAHDSMRIMGEDGLKFIGIGAWFTLHLRAALTVMERVVLFRI